MKALNNKVFIIKLPEDKQPKKTLLNPDADIVKLAEVIEVGSKVDRELKKGDIVTIYINDISNIPGFEFDVCSERAILFVNDYPDKNKVHIKHQKSVPLSLMTEAVVEKSSSDDISDGDVIFFKKGQGLILPDNSEIISESQIFYKK